MAVNIEEITSKDEAGKWLNEYKKTNNSKIKKQLRDLIALAYLPFVKKIAHGLARRSTDPIEDLIQVGSIGLIKAIDQYNSDFGASFKTYATHLITGEIKHYLRDKTSMIRAPRELYELSFRINQIIEKLTVKKGEAPSNYEIAEELQVPISRVNEVSEIERRKFLVSLDQTVLDNNEKDQTLIERIIDQKSQENFITQEDRIMLKEAIEKLDPRLREVINLTFFHDMNQNEISKKLNISQMQVSRNIKKAISQLFTIITSREEESK